MTLIGLSLAPVLAIIWFIYLKDKYEPEPIKHILISFLLGCISIIPAAIFEFSLGGIYPENPKDVLVTAIWSFGIIAFSEEFVKFFMLRFYAYRQKEFDEPFDGIVYGVMISLGFAAVENILYVSEGGWGVALLRMFTAVPAHASFGVIMGYYFGLAWKHKEVAWKYQLRGLLSAVVLHGAYDFFLLQDNYPAFALFSFIGLFISIKLSFKAIKTHQDDSPFHPDVLAQNEAKEAAEEENNKEEQTSL
jgi:RsiW-degrading membrane proteinase PrsW (M82 family)